MQFSVDIRFVPSERLYVSRPTQQIIVCMNSIAPLTIPEHDAHHGDHRQHNDRHSNVHRTKHNSLVEKPQMQNAVASFKLYQKLTNICSYHSN